jgi:hypothetical protein
VAEKEEAMVKVNELRNKIHEIKYSPWNQELVKPSGKMKFMTAYRFFRKEKVAVVKESNPEMDGKARQEVIKNMWRDLSDTDKYPYVLLSRADRERAVFAQKLSKIKESLMKRYPEISFGDRCLAVGDIKVGAGLDGKENLKRQIDNDIKRYRAMEGREGFNRARIEEEADDEDEDCDEEGNNY